MPSARALDRGGAGSVGSACRCPRSDQQVWRTARITCEAHIDDAKVVLRHVQTQRFVWCIRLFYGPYDLLKILRLQARALRDACQHAGAKLLSVVKCPNEGRPPLSD